jgi:hypothetical protein
MPRLTTIYWRDIPAQVIGQQGRKRIKQVLDPRFALAIDRAAMRAGKGSSDLYLEEWQRKSHAVEGDLDELVRQEVARLEALFPEDVLEAVTKAGGKNTADR